MNSKRIVITGGPGSGKTSLISHLEKEGYTCLHEISREVTQKAQEQGIEQLFLEDPILFSERLLEGRLAQFKSVPFDNSNYVFFDRGLPDVTAYMDYLGTQYPSSFSEVCHTNKYDAVFLLPPWETIYEQDNERYESYEEAEKIYEFLKKGYKGYNYDVCLVPVGSIAYRTEFMLNKLNTLF